MNTLYWGGLDTRSKPGGVTDEVAGELGRDVADLLADVGRRLLLDAAQQLGLDGRLHLQGEARVGLLEGRGQQAPQQHRRHLFDLSGRVQCRFSSSTKHRFCLQCILLLELFWQFTTTCTCRHAREHSME